MYNGYGMVRAGSADADLLGSITTYQAGVAQAALNRALQKRCDDILKPFGITKMQWLIIGTVLDAGPSGMRVSDLARTVGTTMSYLTNTINLLVSKGCLVRQNHGSDNRSKLVTVDPLFAPKCAGIEERMREGLRKTIYARVSRPDFLVYMSVIYQLRDIS
jgi:DNA-binding MarR family transcriptional regulator